MSRSASRNFNVWLNLYFVYTTGKTPDNAGQVLKDLLVDNKRRYREICELKTQKIKTSQHTISRKSRNALISNCPEEKTQVNTQFPISTKELNLGCY